MPEQCRNNMRPLAVIRCDHSQLTWQDASLQETGQKLLNIGCLCTIQVASACSIDSDGPVGTVQLMASNTLSELRVQTAHRQHNAD